MLDSSVQGSVDRTVAVGAHVPARGAVPFECVAYVCVCCTPSQVCFPISLAFVVFYVWTNPSIYVLFYSMVIIKGLSYALNNPCKEILYIPTTKVFPPRGGGRARSLYAPPPPRKFGQTAEGGCRIRTSCSRPPGFPLGMLRWSGWHQNLWTQCVALAHGTCEGCGWCGCRTPCTTASGCSMAWNGSGMDDRYWVCISDGRWAAPPERADQDCSIGRLWAEGRTELH